MDDFIADQIGCKLTDAVTLALLTAAGHAVLVTDSGGIGVIGAGNWFIGFVNVAESDRKNGRADNSLPIAIANAMGAGSEMVQSALNAYRDWLAGDSSNERRIGAFSILPSFDEVCKTALEIQSTCSPSKPDDHWIAARHLMAAMLRLSVTESGTANELKRIGFERAIVARELRANLPVHKAKDNAAEWLKFFKQLPDDCQPQVGGGVPKMGREADDKELCLNIHNTSKALAKTIAVGTKGDFCIALKGAWGRGKTTFMNAVEKELKSEPVKYGVVKFNAWKYPQRPEVWVYLYQKIQEKAEEGGWWNKARLIFHQSLEAFGWWPLLGALVLFQISVLPMLSVITGAVQTLGLMATVLVVLFTNNASKFFRTIRLRYFTPTDHSGHLGLQATIGQDLKNLLKVWIRKPEQEIPGKWCACLFSALAVSSVATMYYRFTKHCIFDPQVWDGKPYWIFVSQIGWCAGAFLLAVTPWVLRRPPEGPGRILLVVDDLDRCTPDSMIHIIESIRLLLDDDEVNQRLQTAVLFDEAMLREALATKYAARERTETDEAEKAAREAKIQRLVRGQLDKYFLLEFNLPPLTPNETNEYLKTLLDWDELEAQQAEEAVRLARAKAVEAARIARDEAEEVARTERAEMERKDHDAKIAAWEREKWHIEAKTRPEIEVETEEYKEWKIRNPSGGFNGPSIVRGEVVREPKPQQYRKIAMELSVEERKKAEQDLAAHEQKKPQPLPPPPQPATPPPPPATAPPPANPIDRFAFSEAERAEIRRIFENGRLESPAPRTIRSFLLRCQLAQFILASSNTKYHGPTLIKAVANAYLHTNEAVESGPETRAAKQVV